MLSWGKCKQRLDWVIVWEVEHIPGRSKALNLITSITWPQKHHNLWCPSDTIQAPQGPDITSCDPHNNKNNILTISLNITAKQKGIWDLAKYSKSEGERNILNEFTKMCTIKIRKQSRWASSYLPVPNCVKQCLPVQSSDSQLYHPVSGDINLTIYFEILIKL